MLDQLLLGFSVALTWQNMFYCFLGVFVGTLIGVLPGIGPPTTISLLLPATYYLESHPCHHHASWNLLRGDVWRIHYLYPCEHSWGGGLRGDLSGWVSDGPSGEGRGGSWDLFIGSFIAGTLGIVGLMIAAPPLAKFALRFGPPEYFSLIFMAFSLVIYLASQSMLKAVMATVLGVLVGTIGIDFVTGTNRFSYGSLTLSDGVGLIPVVIGLFGIAEVLENTEKEMGKISTLKTRFKGLFPTLKDWKDSLGSIFRGTFLGFFVGILPGGGTIMASFASYALEKKISKHPEQFGKGAIQGVAAPESANNAASSSAFIPLMTLGLPSNAVTALLLGALMIHGIRPGPMLIQEHPQLFWGVVASMYIGNVMLVVLNLPLIGFWVRVLSVPYRILFPLILLFCLVGVYGVNSNLWEVMIMIVFGIVGYLMRKFKYEPAPFVFAFILGRLMEESLRQSLFLSAGSFGIFFTRPISCILIVIGIFLFSVPALPWFKRKRLGEGEI